MKREMTYSQRVEQSLLTDFRKVLWRPFMQAVRRYALIRPGDKIAVCISGGKDSMLMAKLVQQLARHSEVPFEAVYLIMDPGYNPINRRKVEENARLLDIPCALFESDVFEIANQQERHPCWLCARMRRGCLYRRAQELGCNKIALGHHFDDVIETTLMGMLYGGQIQAMPPKLRAENFSGMEVIRPMYMIRERDVIAWRNAHELSFIQCACRFTENCALCDSGGGDSKRQTVKKLIRQLDLDNPKVSKNIFNSIHTVQLDTLVGWKYRGEAHSFLDDYDERTGAEE